MSNQCINRFQRLDENQTYDPKVLASSDSWAHEAQVAPSKTKKTTTTDLELDRTVKYITGPSNISDEPIKPNNVSKLK